MISEQPYKYKKPNRTEKKLVDYLVKNPKATRKEAGLAVLRTTNPNSAAALASRMLNKPHVAAYLEEHMSLAQGAMIDLLQDSREFASEGGRDGASYAAVAVTIAKDIMDRGYGKATQKVEMQSTAVNLNIDLTGMTNADE